MKAWVNATLPMSPDWKVSRTQGLLDQLDWFESQGIEPHYLAYLWPERLICDVRKRATVTISPARTSFPEARNWQLDELFTSNEAWGLLVDDDAIFDTEPNRIRGNPVEWLQSGKDFPGVDIFIPVSEHGRGAGA